MFTIMDIDVTDIWFGVELFHETINKMFKINLESNYFVRQLQLTVRTLRSYILR